MSGRKRILIIEVNWLGDVLFSTPFIRAVRDNYPDSHIACLVHPRAAGMLESNPAVDELIVYDEEGVHKSVVAKARLVGDLKKEKIDIAYILHRSFTKALIAYLAGAKERIGYASKNRAILLTRPLREKPPDSIHKVEYFLDIARQTGLKAVSISYEFFVSDKDRKFAEDFMKSSGIHAGTRFVAICPGGNWPPKRWPAENFASLCDRLFEKYGLKTVITGSAADRPLAQKITALMKSTAVNTAGLTTIRQLGAILEKASLVVADDTGSMHMAVAMKAPTIALFGPTSPKLTGPYGEGNYRVISRFDKCRVPCYDVSCNDYKCMAAISVEEVMGEAGRLLDSQMAG